ncbi:hypothetical protein SAMN02745108_00232 [Fibrobacter intestinalis]|uniref:Uncharacterized protein n=1 Tax=Fibrobacter intestinalis TaxID=28122 RepID=A0A1T4K0X0_9BACT|nr:hypothetical protein BGW94_1854 [Fibrobacter sp. NR9]SJZ35999.1 hypothetical protein SAMN02745108_00232 [Fibrobacter intestinalis]
MKWQKFCVILLLPVVPPKLNLENFGKANKGVCQICWLAQ